MRRKEEILELLEIKKQDLKDIKNSEKLSFSTIREGIKYYTGYINALEWMIEKR